MFLIPQHYYKLNFLSTYERPFKKWNYPIYWASNLEVTSYKWTNV